MHNVLTQIVFLIFLPVICSAWSGEVVEVKDGDTIVVMHGPIREDVRLYGIDCPEKGRDYSRKATEFTRKMTEGKTAEIDGVTRDRYGRTVAWVTVEGASVNREVVKAGLAWWFRKYCPNEPELEALESQARAQKVGLWSQSDQIPAWVLAKAEAQARDLVMVYHGNTKSRVFHAPTCRHFDCQNCTRVFTSREQAIAAGFRPCGICRP